MRRYALLGERLGHSYSVPIHQAIFRVLGLQADYRLLEIPRGGLGARFPALCRELDGMNVTIPYKEEVMPLLDGVDDFARQVGAVNTVLCRDGASRGYNTDVAGFMAMLERYGIPVAGHPAYVLGTGGASQAARTALKALGAASVTLVSRKPEPGELGYGELAERFSGVLVNCTPVGMYPHGEGCPLTGEQLRVMLPRACGVADMIYNPAETCLTRAAREAGVPACTGLYMLIHQAVEAESIWQGQSLGRALTDQLMKELKLP